MKKINEDLDGILKFLIYSTVFGVPLNFVVWVIFGLPFNGYSWVAWGIALWFIEHKLIHFIRGVIK